MKTAKELARIFEARDDWKHLKLWSWAHDYEQKANDWNNIFPPVTDDRRVFINTYKQVYDAIDSMNDNPCSWVCCAINEKVNEERKMMNGILKRFTEQEAEGK